MCGIIACISQNCISNILYGLDQLQNRGYDSTGIVWNDGSQNYIQKFTSEDNVFALDKLKSSIKNCIHNPLNKLILGMGHTRWATHGAKSDINSHPHSSCKNDFFIVHNGIIENYLPLKINLQKYGYTFQSETDSEIIANLLSYNYSCLKDDFSATTSNTKCIIDAIHKTIDQLDGTWGLVIMTTYKPNALFCVRHGSPLLVSCSTHEVSIVSEVSGFNANVNNYITLENDDICMVKVQDNKIHLTTSQSITYSLRNHTSSHNVVLPKEYSSWYEKEIMEQIDSTLRAISLGGRILSNNEVKLGGLESHSEKLLLLTDIIIIGCGTSLHAAHYNKYLYQDLDIFNTVQVIDGSEFRYKDIPSKHTGIILVSQSGETKDLHRCIEIGINHDVMILGVINTVDSMIAKEVDCGVYLNAGREISVASTKSFTSQCIVLSMIGLWFAQKKDIHRSLRTMHIKFLRNIFNDIETTLNISKKYLSEHKDEMIDCFVKNNNCFLLGKQKLEWIAKEGALKLKEVTYIHAEGYSGGSLKHGPFALLESNYPVILFIMKDDYQNKMINVFHEVYSRECTCIVISDNEYIEHLLFEKSESYDKHRLHIIHIPYNRGYSALLSIIPIQLLSLYIAEWKQINPDKPRNLAKIVSVE